MAVKLNRPVPKELANAPQVHPWLVLFQRAFFDLISDRATQQSPIPWSVRQRWAEVHGLDEEASALLHKHVVAQDLAYLGHMRDTAPSPQEGAKKFGDRNGNDG